VENSVSGIAVGSSTSPAILPTARPVESSMSAGLSSTQLSLQPTVRPVEASSFTGQVQASSASEFRSAPSGEIRFSASSAPGLPSEPGASGVPSPTQSGRQPKGPTAATSTPIFQAPDPATSKDLTQTIAKASTSQLNLQPSAPAVPKSVVTQPAAVPPQQPKASTSLLNVQSPDAQPNESPTQAAAAPSAAPNKATPTQQAPQTEQAQNTEQSQQTTHARAPAAAPSENSAPEQPAAETPTPAKPTTAAKQTPQAETTAPSKPTEAAQRAPTPDTTTTADQGATGRGKSSG
jgi:hypothetical protein